MIITLKKDGVCRECGTSLPVGTRAAWYRNGAVYGLTCHSRGQVSRNNTPAKPERHTTFRKPQPHPAEVGHAPDIDRIIEDGWASLSGLD